MSPAKDEGINAGPKIHTARNSRTRAETIYRVWALAHWSRQQSSAELKLSDGARGAEAAERGFDLIIVSHFFSM